MTEKKAGSEAVAHICGWALFVICAVLFIISSLKNGDRISLAASVVFLAACFFFIVPLIRRLKNRRGK